jgi:hypothetical protein
LREQCGTQPTDIAICLVACAGNADRADDLLAVLQQHAAVERYAIGDAEQGVAAFAASVVSIVFVDSILSSTSLKA